MGSLDHIIDHLLEASEQNLLDLDPESSLAKQVSDAFESLASEQRGAPEEMMNPSFNKGLRFALGLYQWVLEHTGDLINRMAQKPLFFKGGYDWVTEKVAKVLRALEEAYGFEKEVHEQIKSNASRSGIAFEDALKEVKAAGRKYAQAHSRLPIYNRAQWRANKAAQALGNWDFSAAELYLNGLKDVLDKGPDAWKREALKFSLDDSGNLKGDYRP